MLWYAYRRYVALCGISLTFLLYALLLTGRGIEAPHFVLAPGSDSVRHANTQVWRRVSDFLAGRKYAVLAFDGGPYGYGVDEAIMTTLRKHHAHAVFFLVRRQINAANHGVPAKLQSEGHLIDNQCYDHLRLDPLAESAMARQIDGCSQRLTKLTGMKQRLGNANSEDGRTTKPEPILTGSVERAENQSILLMHEKPATEAALDEVLTQLEQRGFLFVLPDQLSEKVAID
ncbi:polysaccharide deacetylase family protein [Dyella choica]|uniref:NodB homology domain-containing protein n=1 Tax=Dyella choica TaxID=1927959 RepID=A0A3S0S9U6_9GAMM|nr:polysaccharide deacetylase family protein [Dyella choica]RUL75251.1 hypothetical protein EKH80_10980 [Dyella choica]